MKHIENKQNTAIEDLQHDLEDEELFDSLSSLFRLYSDPTRIRIIYLLAEKSLCVQDIASILNAKQSNTSHQLAILKNKNVVKAIRQGKKVYYTLSDEHISSILSLGIEHVCEKKKSWLRMH